VDNATVGAHDKENDRRISLDREGNMVMIDPLDEMGELLKVLGPR
jgi:hypothetical protein